MSLVVFVVPLRLSAVVHALDEWAAADALRLQEVSGRLLVVDMMQLAQPTELLVDAGLLLQIVGRKGMPQRHDLVGDLFRRSYSAMLSWVSARHHSGWSFVMGHWPSVGNIALFCGLVSGLLGTASGQERPAPAANAPISFPAGPGYWINSSPISMANLEGKAAFIYCVEEQTCKSLEMTWPAMLEGSRAFADQPIVFIAVITGRMSNVAAYVSRNRITWPVVVIDPLDPNVHNQPGTLADWLEWRDGRCWFPYRTKLKMADGTFGLAGGDPSEIGRLSEQALAGAKWKTDPREIHDSLRSAWASIEFGLASQASKAVRNGLRSKKKDVRSSAELLNANVLQTVGDRLKVAESAKAEGNAWVAYSQAKSTQEEFAGFDLPEGIAKLLTELEADEAVLRELEAMKALESANKSFASSQQSSRKRGVTQLKRVVADFSGTEAARQAEEILQRAE